MAYTLNKLTPNLVVSDVARSIAFYRDVLGFAVQFTVPDAGPLVFAAVQRDSIEIFLNAPDAASEDYAPLKGRPLGGSLTLFIEVSGEIEATYEQLKAIAPIVMPLKQQWYGMTEFAFTDPDGFIVTFAQRTS